MSEITPPNSRDGSSAAIGRGCTLRDLVAGRCTSEEYVRDLEIAVTARHAASGFLWRCRSPHFSWRRQFRWWWTCRIRRKYPMEVYRIVSPQLPPQRTLARLRERVLSGDWETPDVRDIEGYPHA